MTQQCSAKIRVLVLARYGDRAASTRYRLVQYFPYLEKEGFELTVNTLLDNAYLDSLYSRAQMDRRRVAISYLKRVRSLLHAREFDLVWMHFDAFPWIPAWVEKMLISQQVPYVMDLDDAMYHRYDQHSNQLVRVMLGRKIDRVMAGAATVVAGNQYIADRASQAGAKKIAIVPTVVDLERYRVKAEHTSGQGEAVIGWIGSPATAYNLRLMQPALEKLAGDQAFRLITVGSGEIDMGPRVPVEARAWSEATEINDIRSFDIGTMPLYNAAFERGKSGFKLIQCMACGIPVVASPVGVNAEIVTDGLNGFIADSTDTWASSLSVLARDAQLRNAMGKAGRERVEERYSLQRTAPELAMILRNAVH
jgi:glycosyltransferase involved in cell wall biosynthesis